MPSTSSWFPPLIPKSPADVYALCLLYMQSYFFFGLLTIFYTAPHGKWAPRGAKGLKIPGNLGWILMEIWGPVMLILTACSAGTLATSGPLNLSTLFPRLALKNFLSLPTPNKILLSFYVLHYLNRALIQPLRSPPRSPMAPIVPLFAGSFQATNGFLIGNWLAGRTPAYILSPSVVVPPASSTTKSVGGFLTFLARTALPPKPVISTSTLISRPGLLPKVALRSPLFWIGLTGAIIGLVGNIYHDELLANLRREPKTNKIAAEDITPAKNTRSKANGNGAGLTADSGLVQIGENGHVEHQDEAVSAGEHKYSIPRGALFEHISYPNYFCEWLEWFSWALASLIFLPAFVQSPTRAIMHPGSFTNQLRWYAAAGGMLFKIPTSLFAFVEVAVMLPRAIKGHQWYLKTFGERYPKERKAVIPFVL